MKKILLIFATAFILNAVWENLHAFLYDNYMGDKITELVLLRATLADAVMITVITLPFVLFPSWRRQNWIIIFVGLVLAIGIERYALLTDKWAYNVYMPIVPFLSVGLTPTIQLGLLGFLSFRIQEYASSSVWYNRTDEKRFQREY
ncbi:MAG: hypothetical protein A2665_00335 [Candidatus Zambryskibacteria bacterium RIFCSPHIGHO2_01_FULL_46_30]|uniref:Uncharacterized protein n=1 Tax=Candidatus Zambryskibacteria bacterium RIFCSPHIGHO2_01_FULL_46_30 TaxID=1802739 RepID=A0A1G2T724_9BACT|nr:MAG: hypothetical protein A2665_00335 [Candidatus Zambryskibacteria bacterium RIFCSPHIGHO2_01_FULL_46_30]OHB05956.1 MAG: hypothetical protein A3B22_01100 [Candidatus Zambryskibacteria bacterium RIFCSPLOWO2_01_FULL_47_33]